MKYTVYVLSFLLLFLFLWNIVIAQIENEINLTPYDYPKPDEGAYYQIAIFATTDIHGRMFPMIYYNSIIDKEYESGGVEYMGTYISILRNTWKDRFLWFDAGDQMKGGIEYTLSKGEIMNSFFNTKQITAMTLGNHEFDEGVDKLKEHMSKSNFDYIVANLKNKDTQERVFLPKQFTSKMYQAGEVKIGVIGVVTNNVSSLSGGDISGIEFLNHRTVIVKEASQLRTEGAKAIILLAHMGPLCDDKDKMNLLLRTKNDKPINCKLDEEFKFLMNSIKTVVDVVLSGHMHDVSHHWINGTPVVESSGSDYSNVIYLSFNQTNNYKYIQEETIIEGPLPSCPKVFSSTLRCEYLPEKDTTNDTKLQSFVFHDQLMVKDKELEETFKQWAEIINNKRKNKLSKTKSILYAEKNKETTLSNLITDLIKRKTGADFAVFNYGGMRATWYPPDITELDLDIMFPFDDALASFVMTGSELIRLIHSIHRKQNIVPTSGVIQTCIREPDENIKVVDIRLFDGVKRTPISEYLDYKVGGIKFLFEGGGDGFSKIFEWYTKYDYKINYGTIKEAMMKFLQQIEELDDTMFIDENNPRLRFTLPLNKSLY